MAAGNAVIGALRVVLGADTASFEKGLKSAQGKLAGFGAGIAKAGLIAGAAFAAVGVGVAVAVKGAINEADKLTKMAQSIGVPVEELSKLKHAADLSGVGIESLSKGIGRLNRNVVEAAQGLSTPIRAFQALGIEIRNTDGSLKTVSQIMPELASRFAAMRDGPEKTALAMQLLGRAGADLIPLLNAGAGGLKKMMDEAEQLGIVIDSKTGKAAEAFNDNLKRLGKVKDGIITKITAHMLPGLERMSEALVVVAKNANLLKSAGEGIAAMLQGLVSVGLHTILIFQRLGAEWGALREFLQTDIFSGKVAENWAKFRAEGEKTQRDFALLRATLAAGEWGMAFGPLAAGAANASGKVAKFTPAIAGAKSALDGFLDSQKKSLAAQQAELATVGLAAGAKERLKVVLQGLAIAQAQNIPLTDAMRMKLSETAFAAEQMALKLQGAQLVQQNLAPHEAFRNEMDNNRRAMEAFGASAEQIGRVQQAVAERYGATWGQVGQSVAGSFQQIGNAFAKENKSMALVARAAGLVQATISMFVGAAKALELPFPANLAAWATVLATGAQAVAGIKGVQAGGFAAGGSFKVPGGVSMSDNQSVQMQVASGERVTVEPNRYGAAGAGGGGGDRMLTIKGIKPKEYYRGDVLRDLLDNAADLVRNGYKLKLA
jgi:hypothetical protein